MDYLDHIVKGDDLYQEIGHRNPLNSQWIKCVIVIIDYIVLGLSLIPLLVFPAMKAAHNYDTCLKVIMEKTCRLIVLNASINANIMGKFAQCFINHYLIHLN